MTSSKEPTKIMCQANAAQVFQTLFNVDISTAQATKVQEMLNEQLEKPDFIHKVEHPTMGKNFYSGRFICCCIAVFYDL